MIDHHIMKARRTPSQTLIAMVAALLAVLSAPGLSAQVSLETTTSAGILIGTSRELVLSGSYIVSQLDWAMKPLVFTGSGLIATTPAGLRASLEVLAGVPGKTGRITDKDFLNGDGVVTHFSEHDSFTEGALMLDARIGRHSASVQLENFTHRSGEEGLSSREHLEHDNPKRVDIGPLIQGFAVRLFGRSVIGRAQEKPLTCRAGDLEEFSQAEIAKMGLSRAVHQDIGGLDVAM